MLLLALAGLAVAFFLAHRGWSSALGGHVALLTLPPLAMRQKARRRRGIAARLSKLGRSQEAGVNLDYLYMVTHMFAVATGRPGVERLFQLGGVTGTGYGYYTEVLARIASLARKWGYGFATAIKLEARKVKDLVFRDFLTRLSEAIKMGEALDTFLETEHHAALASYEANYDRNLETVKVLMAIYTAAMSSTLFVNVNMVLISVLFFGNPQMVMVSFLATMAVLFTVAYLVYRLLPRDRSLHNLPVNMPERRRFLYTLTISILVGGAAGALASLVLRDPTYTLIALALAVLPAGIYGKRIEDKVKNMESFFTVFIRALGFAYQNTRNFSVALRSVLRSEFGSLERPLKRLYARLVNGIDKRLAWYYFVGETGSESIRRTVDVFFDAVDAGGEGGRIGVTLSNMLSKLIELRKRREQLARTFAATTYILHILVVAIAEFMISLVLVLQDVLYQVSSSLPTVGLMISPLDPNLLVALKIGLVFMLTLSNAFVTKASSGGYVGAAWLSFSVLLLVSGSTMLVMSRLADRLLAMLNVEELLSLTNSTIPAG
jgi:flagellar protein FlaJ